MRHSMLFLCFFAVSCSAVKIINNGLAPPEIVHTPISSKPKCIFKAPPLDLIFILDSSGSLRDKFQDEIDIIRRIVKHVTIGHTATRVMLVQFSGTQHLEFDFNKFTTRDEIFAALDVLRHVSGITRIGGAFEFTLERMNNASLGMRDASVPKIMYLLSDGRTHDFPKDWEMADMVRRSVPNIDIWAYGTGEYVAMTALTNYTRSAAKIVTNKNLHALEPQFEQFKGTEICETIPTCVKGSDKPLDMVLIVDASESLEHLFKEQMKFAIERIIGNIHVHPDAVRLALLTYSGNVYEHFKFNSAIYGNNTAVVTHLKTLRPIKGVTATHLALKEATKLLLSNNIHTGVRANVPKMALVLTDGHSQRSPLQAAEEMRSHGIITMAVSIAYPPQLDENDLLMIGGHPSRTFSPKNMMDFEKEFSKYVGYGCEGLELGPNSKPQVRGATDVSCTANSVTFTVRTQQPMKGLMYAQYYHDDEKCLKITNGDSREVSITMFEHSCGISKTPSENRDGFFFNVTVILQFHPLIMTRADQGLDVSCLFRQPLSRQEIDRSVIKSVADTECSYTLHKYHPSSCVALDAKVGENLFHKWSCDTPPQYQYLVHDCYAQSERTNIQILDSDGCEIDEHFLETPNYSLFEGDKPDPYVYQEMSVFKFPGDGNVVFKCKISICDMEDKSSPCTAQLPPKCGKKTSNSVRPKRESDRAQSPLLRLDRQTVVRRKTSARVTTKVGFYMTQEVETRTLNVLLSESIRPKNSLKYCDIS